MTLRDVRNDTQKSWAAWQMSRILNLFKFDKIFSNSFIKLSKNNKIMFNCWTRDSNIETLWYTWPIFPWIFSHPVSWEYTDCILCSGVRPSPIGGVLSMSLNCIWWWGFLFGNLGSMECPFNIITPWSTLSCSGSTYCILTLDQAVNQRSTCVNRWKKKRKHVGIMKEYRQVPVTVKLVGDRKASLLWPSVTSGWATPAKMQKSCCYGQEKLDQYSGLSLSPLISHTTETSTLSRIKCEIYIFINKCVSFIIMFNCFCFVYVCGYTTVPVKIPLMCLINLFKNYLYLIGPCAKKILKQLPKKCKYECDSLISVISWGAIKMNDWLRICFNSPKSKNVNMNVIL